MIYNRIVIVLLFSYDWVSVIDIMIANSSCGMIVFLIFQLARTEF